MRAIVHLIVILFLIPSVMSFSECQRETPLRDIPCVQWNSWSGASCGSVAIAIYNASNDSVQNLTWQEGVPFCYFVFNISSVGIYPYNSTIDSGSITVIGGDDMASLTIIGVLLLLDIAIFLIPFFVRFNYGDTIKAEIIDYITKRAFWLLAIFLFYYIFLMAADIAIQQNLGIEAGLRGLVHIFSLGIFIALGWLFAMCIITPARMLKDHVQRIRFGDQKN